MLKIHIELIKLEVFPRVFLIMRNNIQKIFKNVDNNCNVC